MSKEIQKRWTKSNNTVYNIGYHLIWCPKYRKKVLVGDVEKLLISLLNDKAKQLSLSIETIEVMPDHIHLFVKCSPVDSPHFIVQQFKGFTSHELRKKFKHLNTVMPSLWTRSYYCESVGHISEEVVKKYIEDQKKV